MKNEKTEEVKLIGEVSPAQIAQWKKQYGDRLYTMVKDGHIGYIRKPDRTTMSYLWTIAEPMKFNESLMENCFLGGSDEFKSNDDFFLAACEEFRTLVEHGKVVLSKI